ncbi:MAG: LysR family transcriptional regulator [Rhodospirillaceae bacterium]|nr:LysR family transcriptional regulator [Rhodospirillaceae bacterium]
MGQTPKPIDVNTIGLRALLTFRAIIREGSVTKAARELKLTQPAASRLLAQLEDTLGFELFYREKGKLIPTSDGLLIFEEINRALDNLDRVNELARDIADFRVGQLKLVAPPSLLETIVPGIAADFLEQYPKVRLTIDSPSIEAAKGLIASRAVDAGFVKLPLNRPDLNSETVMVNESACVMTRDHPLARNSIIKASMLRDQPLILLGMGSSYRTQVEAALAKAGVKPQVRVETHTVSSACALAARGVGIAIVNEGLGRAYVRDKTVLRRFSPSIRHEYAFVTPAVLAPSRLVQAFYELTRTHLSKLQKEHAALASSQK